MGQLIDPTWGKNTIILKIMQFTSALSQSATISSLSLLRWSIISVKITGKRSRSV